MVYFTFVNLYFVVAVVVAGVILEHGSVPTLSFLKFDTAWISSVWIFHFKAINCLQENNSSIILRRSLINKRQTGKMENKAASKKYKKKKIDGSNHLMDFAGNAYPSRKRSRTQINIWSNI